MSDKEVGDVSVGDLIPCQACCCTITSCYCKFPDCIGIKIEMIQCCCQVEEACCKCTSTDNPDKKCCIICDGGCYCVVPSTCCLGSVQCCCIDERAAFPCHEKVPCLCTLLPFCIVAADWQPQIGCCKKIGAVIPRLGDGEAISPGQQEMS